MLIAVNYHYIRKSFDFKYPSFFGVTPDYFRNQLLKIRELGTFVSKADILDHLRGINQLPERAIIITFDDGLKEQYEYALPILQELGIPALFFVNTGILVDSYVMNVHKIHLVRSEIPPSEIKQKVEEFLAERERVIMENSYSEKAIFHYKYDEPPIAVFKYLLNFILTSQERDEIMNRLFLEIFSSEKEIHDQLYMSVDQVKKLSDLGYLGSHGHDHFPIATLPIEEWNYQVGYSNDILENLTGKKTEAFSYPYGSLESCQGLQSTLENFGFEFAFTMERAINESLYAPHFLSRFDNNDMPLGKAWKQGDFNPFFVLKKAAWFQKENR